MAQGLGGGGSQHRPRALSVGAGQPLGATAASAVPSLLSVCPRLTLRWPPADLGPVLPDGGLLLSLGPSLTGHRLLFVTVAAHG